MLQKLVRAVLTIAGAILGFGLYTLTKFLIVLAGHKELVDFSEIQDMIISALVAIIFGLIFFRLTPAFKKQGNKMANNLVYSASGSDVLLTMADGKILYKDGEYQTIDLEKTIYEVNKATQKILASL